MFESLKKYNFWNGEEIPCGFFRDFYFKQITPMIGNKLVKVILGQRRSGKSFVLRMIMQHLINSGIVEKNILYINKEFEELKWISDSESLYNAVDEYRKNLKPEGKVYLFLDEVQEIEGWEKAVNSFAQDYILKMTAVKVSSYLNLFKF
jgi:predicted AAA+ superfamily ATPase